MYRLGYRYIVVDSETEEKDLSLKEFEELVRLCKGLGFPEPVLTVPVRRTDGFQRLNECSEIIESSGFGGVCLVAGNPAYLTPDEAKKNSSKLMEHAAALFRSRCPFRLLMVGTENLMKPSNVIARKYTAVPVMLLTPQTPQESKIYNGNTVSKAVYAPFYVGENPPNHVKEKVRSYVSRRNAASLDYHSYVLVGEIGYMAEKLRDLLGLGIDVFIGYPLDGNPGQLAAIKHAVS